VAGTTNPRHEGIGQCLVLDGLLLAGRLAFVLGSCLNSGSFPFDFRLVFVWFPFWFSLVRSDCFDHRLAWVHVLGGSWLSAHPE
jgi:hypothetical protein